MWTREPTEAQITALTHFLYGSCASCGHSLDGHDIALLASAMEPSEARLRDLIATKDWHGAATIREWRGDEDELEYRIIRCPRTTELTMLEIRSFAALEFDDYVVSRTKIDVIDVDLEWKRL